MQTIKYHLNTIKKLGYKTFLTDKLRKINIRLQFYLYKNFYSKKNGLEIGGPSSFFMSSGVMPVYPIAKSIDGVNFASDTIWSNKVNGNDEFIAEKKALGKLFITDAVDLSNIKNNRYDFVLSCNNLEHIANPIKALKQWLSVLKSDGIIVVIVPRKESNFDHRRKVVELSHLIDDYENDIGEDDLTHLSEILELHDLSMDLPAGTKEEFKIRSEKNFENRCLHHHVFDLSVLNGLFDYLNLKVLNNYRIETDYIIIGRKQS